MLGQSSAGENTLHIGQVKGCGRENEVGTSTPSGFIRQTQSQARV